MDISICICSPILSTYLHVYIYIYISSKCTVSNFYFVSRLLQYDLSSIEISTMSPRTTFILQRKRERNKKRKETKVSMYRRGASGMSVPRKLRQCFDQFVRRGTSGFPASKKKKRSVHHFFFFVHSARSFRSTFTHHRKRHMAAGSRSFRAMGPTGPRGSWRHRFCPLLEDDSGDRSQLLARGVSLPRDPGCAPWDWTWLQSN